LISASADKNVKIWGLDFGDLHKSFFAHQDSVMKYVYWLFLCGLRMLCSDLTFVVVSRAYRVQFVNNTHYFFSVGKDKLLKYWDADKFEHVLTLSAHHSEVWGLTVSSIGDFVVTGGNDRSLRIWTQTDEPVFLDSEREKERNEAYEKHVSTEQQKIGVMAGSGIDPDNAESAAVSKGKATPDMLRDSERLIELLDISIVDVRITTLHVSTHNLQVPFRH
jgi:U3 small nucleolar RNA-associated protein 12